MTIWKNCYWKKITLYKVALSQFINKLKLVFGAKWAWLWDLLCKIWELNKVVCKKRCSMSHTYENESLYIELSRTVRMRLQMIAQDQNISSTLSQSIHHGGLTFVKERMFSLHTIKPWPRKTSLGFIKFRGSKSCIMV